MILVGGAVGRESVPHDVDATGPVRGDRAAIDARRERRHLTFAFERGSRIAQSRIEKRRTGVARRIGRHVGPRPCDVDTIVAADGEVRAANGISRTSSLASLVATPLTLPLLAWQEPSALLPMTVLTGLIVWRHRSNLRDLIAGRERHF